MGCLGGHAVHPIKQGLSWPRARTAHAGVCASLLASPSTCLLPSPSSVWLPPLQGWVPPRGSAWHSGRQAAEVGKGALASKPVREQCAGQDGQGAAPTCFLRGPLPSFRRAQTRPNPPHCRGTAGTRWWDQDQPL